MEGAHMLTGNLHRNRSDSNMWRQMSGLKFEDKVCLYACGRWRYRKRYVDCFQCHNGLRKIYPHVDLVGKVQVTARCGYPRYLEDRFVGFGDKHKNWWPHVNRYFMNFRALSESHKLSTMW